MSWDVVVRIGNSDSFAPISQGGPVLGVSFDRPGDPFWLGKVSLIKSQMFWFCQEILLAIFWCCNCCLFC